MMLSISGKMRTLLKKLKSKPSRTLEGCFPHCLPPEFERVWNEYLESKMVKDIVAKHGNNIVSQYYVAALFLSYMSRFTRITTSLGAYDLYDPLPFYRRMSQKLTELKLLKKLNLTFYQHSYTIRAEDVKWARCLIDPACEGIITYKLNGRKPLEAYLTSLVPSVFGSLPNELCSDSAKDKKSRRKVKLVTPEQQVSASFGWVTLFSDSTVSMEIARARYSTILIRYKFVVPGFFCYGAEDPSKFSRQLRARHEANAFVPK